MADTNFTPRVTKILSTWLQDINDFVYRNIGASSGSTLVGFIQSGSGASPRTVQAKEREIVSVTDFYANGVSGALVDNTGVTDSSLGFQAAFNSISTGEVFAPKGTYKVNSGWTMGQRKSFRGEGQQATILSFTPTADNTACIRLTNGAAVCNQNNLSGFAIVGGGTKIKIGIRLDDVSECRISNIAMSLMANESIGIDIRGREHIYITECELGYVDYPVRMRANVNGGIINADHVYITRAYFLSTAGHYHVTIDDGVAPSNIHLDGGSYVAGDGVIYYNDTTATGAALNISVRNIRAESQADSSKYLFRLASTAQAIQNVLFDNVYGGLVARGWYLRNVNDVTFMNTQYANPSNNEALNVDSTVWRMCMINAKWQSGTTATLTGQRLVFGAVPVTGPLADFGFYETTNGAVANFGRFDATGVTFPAIQVASANPNTLDDYEEGTWTPSVGGNATYTARTASYTKIGRLVYVTMDMDINVIGTGSATTISGLPFTAADYSALACGFYFNLSSNVVELNPVVQTGATTIVLYSQAAAGASLSGSTGVMGNTTRINISGTYYV